MGSVYPAPGTLRLSPAKPNPYAAADSQLFILHGDATAAPIQNIELTPGVALPHQSQFLNSCEFDLHIFHFNDLHGHLMRFTQEGEEAVLARIAGKIQTARQKYLNQPDSAVLVFSAGDDCSGSIFDEIIMDKSQDKAVHPGYQLYTKMGVDVGGLGNHDLDRGLPFLADAIQSCTQFPVLAANLKGCATLMEVCHPAALLVVKGIRIGLVGLVTRAEINLDPNECQIVDPIPVAKNLVDTLRPRCDVLILISHLGYSLESPVPMADAGDVEVANSLPYGSADLIVGGHSHTELNRNGLVAENIVNGIPIVQAGSRGEYLGQVDIEIRKNSVKVTNAHLILTDSLPVNLAFEREMQIFTGRARELWNQPLGQVESIPDLNTQIILTDFAKREMALANFITDALVERLTQRGFQVEFAMIDASALQRGLPFSDHLTYGNCFEVMPYTDSLRLYQITGRQLQDILVDNARRADRPGESDQERGFLQFSRDIRYAIDLGSERMMAQAFEVTLLDTPLDTLLEETFTVVTTSFIRILAAPWEMAWGSSSDYPLLNIRQYPYKETDFLLRQEIIAHIRENGGVTRSSGAQQDGRLIITCEAA
jgi:2',3'-cyclic-nucleotide 2'-phosphodiesterase (5'-nucleotidase family)